MSNPFSESVEKEVWYPDDLPELGRFEVHSDEPVDADEVPHDQARYGQWVQVENGAGPVWAAAPHEFRGLIGEAWEEHGDLEGVIFEVFEAEKGPKEHDSWEIDGEFTEP